MLSGRQNSLKGAGRERQWTHCGIDYPAVDKADVKQVEYRDFIREFKAFDAVESDVHVHACAQLGQQVDCIRHVLLQIRHVISVFGILPQALRAV